MLVATNSHRFPSAIFLVVLFIQKVKKPFSVHKFCEEQLPTFDFKDQPEIPACMSDPDGGSQPITCRHTFMKTWCCLSLLMLYLFAFLGKAGTNI